MVRYLVRNASYNRMLTWKYRSTELASLLPVYFKNEAKDQKRKYLFSRKDQAVMKRQRLKKTNLKYNYFLSVCCFGIIAAVRYVIVLRALV